METEGVDSSILTLAASGDFLRWTRRLLRRVWNKVKVFLEKPALSALPQVLVTAG